MPFRPASAALSRFTVLDLTRVRSGPTCVRQLADWGANVIKIEMPSEMQAGDAPGGAWHGPDFQGLHRNKRSLTLNLKSKEGREVLKRLVQKADVMVENYRPDVKHRLGIDYETLSEIRPELVYASISGFGQDGPYVDRPGFDQIAQGMGGLMSVTGAPGAGPMRVGVPIADLSAGMYCAIGILVALLEREESGRGQWVQTSLLEAQIAMLDFQATRWLMDRDVPKQAGNNHPTMIPTGVFETADGYMNLAVTGQVMWERFCRAVNAEHLMEEPDYKTAASRLKNRDALNARIDDILRARTTEEWMEHFVKAEVPAGPIYEIDKMFDDPQVKHLQMSASIEAPALGRTVDLVRQPVSLSRSPSTIAVPSPKVGEHTDEILGEFGFAADDISKLRADGVI
jgi:crotonobetainyl-CoA:carnitine CoA-transferase CaiB-like acyl-CoA transferase